MAAVFSAPTLTGPAPFVLRATTQGSTVTSGADTFRHCKWRIDFGDAADTSNWPAGPTRARVTGLSPMGNYCYRNPGTYTARATLTDPSTGESFEETLEVTVTDTTSHFSRTANGSPYKTTLISTSGNFTGAPNENDAEVTQVTFSDPADVISLIEGSSGDELFCFRGGETFNFAANSCLLSAPRCFFASGDQFGWGSGAAKIQMTGDLFQVVGTAQNRQVVDQTFWGIAFDGRNSANARAVLNKSKGYFNRFSIIDCSMERGRYLAYFDGDTDVGFNNIGFACIETDQASVAPGVSSARFMFVAARGGCVLGCTATNQGLGREQVIRVRLAENFQIGHCDLSGPDSSKGCIKAHALAWNGLNAEPDFAPEPGDPNAFGYNETTNRIHVHDCYLDEGDDGSTFGPANRDVDDHRVEEILVERNFSTNTASGSPMWSFNCRGATARNNVILKLSTTANVQAFQVGAGFMAAYKDDLEQRVQSSDIEILHNSVYGARTTGKHSILNVNRGECSYTVTNISGNDYEMEVFPKVWLSGFGFAVTHDLAVNDRIWLLGGDVDSSLEGQHLVTEIVDNYSFKFEFTVVGAPAEGVQCFLATLVPDLEVIGNVIATSGSTNNMSSPDDFDANFLADGDNSIGGVDPGWTSFPPASLADMVPLGATLEETHATDDRCWEDYNLTPRANALATTGAFEDSPTITATSWGPAFIKVLNV